MVSLPPTNLGADAWPTPAAKKRWSNIHSLPRGNGGRIRGALGGWGIAFFASALVGWLGLGEAARAADLLSPGIAEQRVVAESSGTVTIQVPRLALPGMSGEVDVWTTNGWAVAGEDFVPVSKTLRFGPSDMTLPVVIELLDDGRVEGDETFAVVVRETGVGPEAPEVFRYEVRIEDDEEPAVLDETFRPDLRLGTFYFAPQGAVAAWATPGGDVAAVVEEADELTPFGPVPRSRIVVLNRAGQVQRSTRLAMGAMQVLEDEAGRHLVLGSSVVRVLADGSLDPTFNPDLLEPLNGVNGSLMAIQGDGKFLLGGRLGVFVRYRPDGTKDETFHSPTLRTGLSTNGPVVEGWVSAARVLADGSILIGGDFTRVNDVVRIGIARLKPNGELDPEFNLEHGLWTQTDPLNPATSTPGMVRGFDLDREGRILVSGSFTLAGATRRPYLVRLRPTGELDPAFPVLQLARTSQGSTPALHAAAEMPDGDLVVAGRSFDQLYGSPRVGLARITTRLTDSRLVFARSQINVPEYAGAANVTVHRSGDTTQLAQARVKVTPGTATAGADFEGSLTFLEFAPKERVQTITIPIRNDDLPESDETFTVELEAPQGATLANNASTRVVIRDDDRAGAREWTFHPPAVEDFGAVIPQPDETTFIGARAASPGQLLARLRPDGSIDATWAPGSVGPRILAAFSDGRVLVGALDAVVGSVFRLRPDGAFDPRWNLASAVKAAGTVERAIVDAQERVILTTWVSQFVGGEVVNVYTVFRLNRDGSLDGAFQRYPLRGGDLEGMTVEESGAVLLAVRGATRQWPDGSEYPELQFTRLTSGGVLDASYQPPLRLKRFDYGTYFAPQPDGRCWVAAATEFVAGGRTTAGVVRLRADGAVDESSIQGAGFRRADGQPARLTALVRLPDGRLLVSGLFTEVHGVPRRHVVRLEANGALDPSFDLGDELAFGVTSTGAPDVGRAWVTGLAVTASGQLLIRGGFDSFNGEPAAGLAQVVLGTSPWLRVANAGPGSGARVDLSGVPGQRYVLEESADLRQWDAVATNAADSGRITFDRPPVANSSGRYFRAVRP